MLTLANTQIIPQIVCSIYRSSTCAIMVSMDVEEKLTLAMEANTTYRKRLRSVQARLHNSTERMNSLRKVIERSQPKIAKSMDERIGDHFLIIDELRETVGLVDENFGDMIKVIMDFTTEVLDATDLNE